MLTRNRVTILALVIGAAIGCTDAPTQTAAVRARANLQATKFWDAAETTRWNLRATNLHQTLPPPPNGQAWASRMLTYLSVAQHRAVLAATSPSNRRMHPSVSAAVARASVTVLREFFAAHVGVPNALEQQLLDDRSAPSWPGDAKRDVADGDAIGLAVGLEVVAQSKADGYLSLSALTPPLGDGFWMPNGDITRSLWGAKPFFLEPADLLLAPDPPAFSTPEFKTARDEVYAILSARTPAQLAIALKWNVVPPNGPSTAGEWNRIADSLIRKHHSTEAEAARILAYGNAAAFDAQIDCFMTKFTWWVARPFQVDSRIASLIAFAAPNHPSYPSSHSCVSSAMGAVLADAFPSERTRLNALVLEAGLSRVYAGIHYRFDIDAGQNIGRRAAAKALGGSLE